MHNHLWVETCWKEIFTSIDVRNCPFCRNGTWFNQILLDFLVDMYLFPRLTFKARCTSNDFYFETLNVFFFFSIVSDTLIKKSMALLLLDCLTWTEFSRWWTGWLVFHEQTSHNFANEYAHPFGHSAAYSKRQHLVHYSSITKYPWFQ